ncbi:lactosylceramide 1,3-N-acetyl-beta-D-glucosaminyltransferase [Aplysia californica]|uniref:Hexosyltransferase n=1 Tax=Aplysia californica TaxID=6500 RepID=A0ABM1A4X9_APLCA|nr:lactosylceramide 1,3-N-acetyl-beta-D-glucosaminyltransferase [Aplysia californica]
MLLTSRKSKTFLTPVICLAVLLAAGKVLFDVRLSDLQSSLTGSRPPPALAYSLSHADTKTVLSFLDRLRADLETSLKTSQGESESQGGPLPTSHTEPKRYVLQEVKKRSRSYDSVIRDKSSAGNIVVSARENSRNEISPKLSDEEGERSVAEVLAKPLVNKFYFKYISHPRDLCSKSKTETIFVIPSGPGNFQRREWVRSRDVSKYVKVAAHKAKMLFFVGRPNKENVTIQRQLEKEAKTYGDMALLDFEDTYKNILTKHLSMLNWTMAYCSSAMYVIRTDDDARVDAAKMVSAMWSIRRQTENFVVGVQHVGQKPIRYNKHRYYLSLEDFPDPTFPPYVLGGAIGYPMTTVHLLYQAALRLRPVWLDDVFITGICTRALNVPVISHSNFTFVHMKKT